MSQSDESKVKSGKVFWNWGSKSFHRKKWIHSKYYYNEVDIFKRMSKTNKYQTCRVTKQINTKQINTKQIYVMLNYLDHIE